MFLKVSQRDSFIVCRLLFSENKNANHNDVDLKEGSINSFIKGWEVRFNQMFV